MIAKMQCGAVRMTFRPCVHSTEANCVDKSLKSLPILLDVDDPIYAIRLGNDDVKSVESSVAKASGIYI